MNLKELCHCTGAGQAERIAVQLAAGDIHPRFFQAGKFDRTADAVRNDQTAHVRKLCRKQSRCAARIDKNRHIFPHKSGSFFRNDLFCIHILYCTLSEQVIVPDHCLYRLCPSMYADNFFRLIECFQISPDRHIGYIGKSLLDLSECHTAHLIDISRDCGAASFYTIHQLSSRCKYDGYLYKSVNKHHSDKYSKATRNFPSSIQIIKRAAGP